MANKAKKTGIVLRGKYSDVVQYEYRGKLYDVEYAKDMTYCCTAPGTQHRDAQEKIDRMIESEQRSNPIEYEDTAEYGLDMFFDYLNQ